MAKAAVDTFFDGYARDFDSIYQTRHGFVNGFVNKYLRASMRLRYEASVKGCFPIKGKTVLDIGTGPGHYAVDLAQRGGLVTGIDFAEGMLDVARSHAEQAGVADRCTFQFADFHTYSAPQKFDYSILCGFMDYMAEPNKVIEKAASVTTRRAFFSFPRDDGFLAWQRKLRYKAKCDLYLYNRPQLERLFGDYPNYRIEELGRDYFVTIALDG